MATNTVTCAYAILLKQKCSSSYNVNISKSLESIYAVAQPAKTISCEYTYTHSQVVSSNYSILVSRALFLQYNTLLEHYTYTAYSIVTGSTVRNIYILFTQNTSESSYRIIPTKKVYSEYFIEEIIHTTVEWKSSYNVNDTDRISVVVEGRYEVSLEGLSAGTSIQGFTSSAATHSTERVAAPRTYTTHTCDRNCSYTVYSTITNTRKALIQRVLPLTERHALTEGYSIYTDKRTGHTSCLIQEDSKRQIHSLAVLHSNTERSVFHIPLEPHATTERYSTWFGGHTTSRYITLKVWYAAQRTCYTCGIPYTPKADQRFCWPQVSIAKFEIIRTCYTEGYAVKVQYIINTHYVEVKTAKVSATAGHFVPLFSGEVTDETLVITQVPVNTAYKDTDLIIAEPNGQSYNLSIQPLVSLQTTQISENVVSFFGYIIPVQHTTYLKFRFLLPYQKEYPNPDDYYKYLLRHGYLKLVVESEEVHDEEVLILNHPPLTPVPFRISLYKQILYTTEMEVIWGYPYIAISTYRGVLIFR